MLYGQHKIATAGKAVQIGNAQVLGAITICAPAANNAAGVTLGGPGVTGVTDGTGNGFILYPGQSVSFGVSQSGLYFNSAHSGDIVTFYDASGG